VYGAREAAWPLVRHDLHLTYAGIGVLLSVPELVAAVVEPPMGLLADAGRRRMLVLAGGVAFAVSLVLTGLAWSLAALLLAFALFYPASGAFASLSQSSLMDLQPDRREKNMARWTLVGSIGVVAGPVVLLVAVSAGVGWRGTFLLFAALTAPLVLLAARTTPAGASETTMAAGLRAALSALRSWRIVRWLLLLAAGDLMGDVLTGYLALYMVDVAGVDPARAGAAVVVLAVAGLAGDTLLLPLLERVPGTRHLRLSAMAVLLVYPAFLLLPGFIPKLVPLALLGLLRAGWYAVPQARLYDEIPEASGSMLVLANAAGLLGSSLPIVFGLAAQRAGFGMAMWLLMLGPVALLVLAERRQS